MTAKQISVFVVDTDFNSTIAKDVREKINSEKIYNQVDIRHRFKCRSQATKDKLISICKTNRRLIFDELLKTDKTLKNHIEFYDNKIYCKMSLFTVYCKSDKSLKKYHNVFKNVVMSLIDTKAVFKDIKNNVSLKRESLVLKI